MTTGERRYDYIDGPAALGEACAQLQRSPWLALDTEFIRDKTYYPRLCLIQAATADYTACIDPLALADLEPLFEVIYDPRITKVLHACRQDLEIFFHLRGAPPAPVFDTQVAAPLLGHPQQMSYAELVKKFLKVSLTKDLARTDWARRPLSRAQLEYAVDDVAHLGPLYLELRAALGHQGRLAWLAEDFARLSDPELYANPPQEAWRRLRAAHRLRGPQLAVLQALAAWRESTAQSEDKPRGWLLPDDVLLEIARHMPATINEMGAIRNQKRQVLQRYGGELVELVRSARQSPPVPVPGPEPGKARLDPGQEALLDALMAVVRIQGAEYSLNPASIATRADLARLVLGEDPAAILGGWKAAVAGAELRAALDGRLALRAADGRLRIVRAEDERNP